MQISHFTSVLLVLCLASLAFGLASLQAFMGAKMGSDHAGHTFIIRGIRANGYRLFTQIPGLLNGAMCGALPLYLHWIFAHLPPKAMFWAERLLNPALSAVHVLLFAFLAREASSEAGLSDIWVVITVALFALTPQLYHALSAKNFGLSARGIGLLLLTAFFFAAYLAGVAGDNMGYWALLALAAYLIWGFSTFAAQAMVILAVLAALMTGRGIPMVGAGLGLLLFVAVHPRYSISYLRYTLRFIHGYATEVAPLYILNRRYSIWRDLISDIWTSIRRNPRSGLRYAYENSVLVVAVLNPLLLVALWAVAGGIGDDGIIGFSADIALCGAVAALLTSFRPTRFLGEPERYAESVIPWATIAGAAFVAVNAGATALAAIATAFLALALLQLYASRMLFRYLSSKPLNLGAAEAAIKTGIDKPIRCCSNNEQLTKLLMQNDWEFSYYISAGQPYCGMAMGDAFTAYPYLKREACARIVEAYRINACVLDRTQYDSVFDTPPAGLRASRIIYESEGLRVLALEWEPVSASPRAAGADACA